jgi:hypothetical protein
MPLSADRIAIADRAIRRTFERCSVAWQAVPHWDTGDPAQLRVRRDVSYDPARPQGPLGGNSIPLTGLDVPFRMTLAQATAPTPDALLAAATTWTVPLARAVDQAVLGTLYGAAVAAGGRPSYRGLNPAARSRRLVRRLIAGRRVLEDAGYRGQSCLLAATRYFTGLNRWVNGTLAVDALLRAANANSLYRATQLNAVPNNAGNNVRLMLMLGRRQDIPSGGAAAASAGEEPADIAVSVPPSLEVVGERANGQIDLLVRIRFATRLKDERGVVVFHS